MRSQLQLPYLCLSSPKGICFCRCLFSPTQPIPIGCPSMPQSHRGMGGKVEPRRTLSSLTNELVLGTANGFLAQSKMWAACWNPFISISVFFINQPPDQSIQHNGYRQIEDICDTSRINLESVQQVRSPQDSKWQSHRDERSGKQQKDSP